jgi:hypothetical protein
MWSSTKGGSCRRMQGVFSTRFLHAISVGYIAVYILVFGSSCVLVRFVSQSLQVPFRMQSRGPPAVSGSFPDPP